jgi:hypothetical protein
MSQDSPEEQDFSLFGGSVPPFGAIYLSVLFLLTFFLRQALIM